MAHLTVAANEKTFVKLFDTLRDNFQFEKSDSVSFGQFTAAYHIKLHLEGGSVDLRSDNTIKIEELDIKWDILDLTLGFDIPEICIGGFCIIPIPFDGCALEFPEWCVFEDNPDIEVTLPLGGFTSEITAVASLLTKYTVHPERLATMDAWDAQDTPASPTTQTPFVKSVANRWQIFVDPQTLDIDPIDIADTVGDLLENLVEAAIDNLLFFLPGFVKDIIKAILGSIIDLIRVILDIPDDIQEWISDLLNVSIGILNIVATVLADFFAAKFPILEIEDPYPMLPKADNPNTPSPDLVPVKIPILDLKVFNNDVEMVLEANVG
jgi:hypothetical protein